MMAARYPDTNISKDQRDEARDEDKDEERDEEQWYEETQKKPTQHDS